MWLCMPLFVRFVLLVLLCVCSVVLGGCTSSRITLFDGDPYTPNDVKEMVEERFRLIIPVLCCSLLGLFLQSPINIMSILF